MASGPGFPLRRRVVLFAVAGTAAIAAMIELAAGALVTAEAEEHLESMARLMGALVAERLEGPLSAGDRAAVARLANLSVGRGGVVAVAVIDVERRTVAAAPEEVLAAPPLAAWPPDVDLRPRFTVTGIPVEASFQVVRRGGDEVGGVWLAVDRRPVEQTRARFRIVALVSGAIAVGLAWVLSWLAAGRLARRADRVAEQLEAVTAEQANAAAEFDRQLRDRTRQIEQANRLLRDIANRDALTQLYNRLGLEMEMEKYLSLCRRSGQPLAVIMMDLDSFKAYNDTRGHAAGDTALATVAAALRARARASDVVARLGGDEFCILIPFTKPDRAVPAAEGFVAAVVDATMDLPRLESGAQLGASAGVACFPEDGDEGAELLARADAALYRAKAAGRGRVFRSAPQEPGKPG